MDLQATVRWAKSLDMMKIDEKHRNKAKCYADMIIEKSGTVSVLTEKISRYMDDVQEYLGQLEKLNLTPEPKVHTPVEEPKPPVKSPLLP